MDPQRRIPLTVAIDTTPRQTSTLTTNSGKFEAPRPAAPRKESLLTQALTSASESASEDEPELHFSRESSSADLTSDCGFTSSGTRGTSPSPRLFNFHQLPTVFSKPDFNQTRVAIRTDDDNLSPLDKPTGESNVEANLGRKRCITFACGNKKSSTPPPSMVESPPKTEAPPKRCTIRFACPSKVSTEKPSEEKKPKIARAASPAPALLKQQQREASRSSPRPHRDSDSTVRNDSPKAIRKHHFRKLSSNSDLGKFEATRFHAFGSAEEEVDDWTRESTCHRSRLTVSDTLKVENGLRKLGEEAEEEAIEEEIDDDDDDDVDADDDLDDMEDDDEDASNDFEEDSDDGFHTDNEAGFASSDDESDAGSDFDWWAPGGGASTAATSADHLDLIRPTGGRRSFSDSSVGSPESSSAFLAQFKASPNPLRRRKRRPVDIKVEPTPELPDSTDFVCGTLDEDRPLEDAYVSAIERRRAAKHRATPQDIDPTFPTSDPELDEEDEDEAAKNTSDNDRQLLMHGSLDSIDSVDIRGRNKKVPTPKRLRSPPPMARRTRSPPPPLRRAITSPVRAHSPAPVRRHSLLQSPPAPVRVSNLHFVGMAERPCITIAASLPRAPISHSISPLLDDDDDNNDLPSRGAIDIKAGLEQKRQRRLQKLYQKHCRKQAKEGEKKPLLPGRGAERMREIGLEIAAYNKSKRAPLPILPAQQPPQDPLIISI